MSPAISSAKSGAVLTGKFILPDHWGSEGLRLRRLGLEADLRRHNTRGVRAASQVRYGAGTLTSRTSALQRLTRLGDRGAALNTGRCRGLPAMLNKTQAVTDPFGLNVVGTIVSGR